jgi:hypothetical protein
MNFEFAKEEYWKDLTFDEAKMYCFSLTINGKTGWRLPSVEELKQIYFTPYNGFVKSSYWTSSVCKYSKKIFVMNLLTGKPYHDYNTHYVRPVRALKDD